MNNSRSTTSFGDESNMSRSPRGHVKTGSFENLKEQTTMYQDIINILYSVAVVFDSKRYDGMTEAFEEFIFSIPGMIPDSSFRDAYVSYIQTVLLPKPDTDRLFKWVYNLNVTVAKATKSYVPTFKQVKLRWSPDNFDKTTWAHPLWRFIHASTSLMGPNPSNTTLEVFKQFMYALQKVIPCPKCSKHLEEKLSDECSMNCCFEKSSSPFMWSIDLHNCVNRDTGRPIFPISKALELYGDVM